MAADRAGRRDLGFTPEVLRKRVRRAKADSGCALICPAAEREEIRKLRQEIFELRRANKIEVRLGVFRQGVDADRPK